MGTYTVKSPVVTPVASTHTITNYHNPTHFTAVSNGAVGPKYIAKNGPVTHVVKREAEAEAEADPLYIDTSIQGTVYPSSVYPTLRSFPVVPTLNSVPAINRVIPTVNRVIPTVNRIVPTVNTVIPTWMSPVARSPMIHHSMVNTPSVMADTMKTAADSGAVVVA